MIKKLLPMAIAAAFAAGSAQADSFVNGGFDGPNPGDAGTTNGWTVAGSTYRANVNNANLTPAFVIANAVSGGVHSAIITAGTVDPRVGAALGTTVYSGNYSFRVEDTTTGGYASLIEQKVVNYNAPDIYFAWKAVLDGAHGPTSAATIKILLHDDSTNTDLVSRTYNAASGGGGVDPRFLFDGTNYYTKDWQIEQLSAPPVNALGVGDTLTLSVLASDCQPTGHWGYVYLDGFGSVNLPPGGDGTVPEPGSLALLGLGLAGLAASRRRKSGKSA